MYKALKCIKGGKIILKDGVVENKVLIFNEKIVDILDLGEFEKKGLYKKMGETIDASNKYISPGLIDIHIHGSGGKDAMDGDMQALETISKTIAKNGVTAFLPTTMTMSKENIYKALNAARLAMKGNISGARVLGVHMEGPFISEKYKGAHKKEFILKPSFKFIEDYLDVIKIITMAPEEDEGFRFIKEVRTNSDIVLSMGHTNADYETAMQAVKCGINHATHTFNAMTPLQHRKPGAVGAVLRSDVTFEMIADNIHLHPDIYQIMLNAKGKDKMVLITDCIRAGCMRDGISELGGQKVIVKDNSARLEDGTLAGSILTLNKAVFNILKYTDLKINEAVALASLNPAEVIGMDKEKGSIEIGKDADLAVFDEKLDISLTIIEGKIVYKNNRGDQIESDDSK